MRTDNPQKLNEVFHALSDATRRRLIDRLSDGPASVSELARPLDMALPSVVKHLAVLKTGGLVTSSKTGRVRTYRIAPDAIAVVESWLATRKAIASISSLPRRRLRLGAGEANDAAIH